MSSDQTRDNEPPGIPDEHSSTVSETQIDLGDDLLLEKTLGKTFAEFPKGSKERQTALLKSVDILIEEGLHHDAKRVLRKMLRDDPAQVEARMKLQSVLEAELNQLIHSARFEEPVVQKSGFFSDRDESIQSIEAELGIDLRLPYQPFSLSREAIQQFRQEIKTATREASLQDLLDMGIGMLEMGQPEVAWDLFERVQKQSFLDENSNQEVYISATYLLAQSALMQQKPLEAIALVERILVDGELSTSEKCEGAFLMGLAHEALKQWLDALGWYEIVEAINPDHRSIESYINEVKAKLLKENQK